MRRYLVPSYPVRTAVLCVAIVTAAVAPFVAFVASAPTSAPPAATPPAAAANWTTIRPTPEPDEPGAAGPPAGWTVTVRIPSSPDPDGPTADLGDLGQANALAAAVRAAGFQPRVERVDWPGRTATTDGVLGWRVRVGVFGAEAQAVAAATPIHAAGFTTVIDPLPPKGN